MKNYLSMIALLVLPITSFSSLASAETLQVGMQRTSKTSSSQTFCTTGGNFTLEHPDGGVLTFSSICIVMTPDDRGNIQLSGGGDITWMNHHLGIRPSVQLYADNSTTAPLGVVNFDYSEITCKQNKVFLKGLDGSLPANSALTSSSDYATLILNWSNPDNSLC